MALARSHSLSEEEAHYEHRGVVRASPATLFVHLDDHTRLSGHMEKASWRTLWAYMRIRTDGGKGQQLGSRITLEGAVMGIRLLVEEEVTVREPPSRKHWRTVGAPKLLVIGHYTMGFSIEPHSLGSSLRVFIDYTLCEEGIGRWVSRLLARPYARWCAQQMVHDAERYFEGPR